MLKLHQLLALHKQAFSNGEGALTRAYQDSQKAALLAGVTKTYEPVDDNGQRLPSEGTKLQLRVPVLLRTAVPALVRQFDVQATVDAGNQLAKANVVVDGVTILFNVPVETLLFIEKKLNTLVEVIGKLPTLDEAEDWDDAGDKLSFKSKPLEKTRTDKVPERFEKAAATEKHPAQVEILYLDKVVGTWTTVKFSGGIRASRKADLLVRLDKLREAVKIARSEANSTEVDDQKIGQAVFDFLGWAE